MASRGSVQDSSLTSPRTPKAPFTLPSRMRRPGSWFIACSGPEGRRAAGLPRPDGSGGRSGLGRFLVEHGDLVGQLRALGDPALDLFDVEFDALLVALGNRVVVTDALDVAAVAGAA